jgi:hypothetical protein
MAKSPQKQRSCKRQTPIPADSAQFPNSPLPPKANLPVIHPIPPQHSPPSTEPAAHSRSLLVRLNPAPRLRKEPLNLHSPQSQLLAKRALRNLRCGKRGFQKGAAGPLLCEKNTQALWEMGQGKWEMIYPNNF